MTRQKILPVYTLDEVNEHKTEDDCWVAVNNRVFNITRWLNKHPGGKQLLLNLGGRDCSDEFRIFHYKPNFTLLNTFVVGELHSDDWRRDTAVSKDLQKLHDKIRADGAFEPDCKLLNLFTDTFQKLFMSTTFFSFLFILMSLCGSWDMCP
jgi:Cytochrome b involved in lipid metabolism